MASPKISKMHRRVRTASEGSMNTPLGSKGKHIANNSFWDDAQKLHTLATDAVGRVGAQVLDLVADQEAVARCEDPAALELCLNTLRRDMSNHLDRLNAIQMRHAGKSGNATIEEVQEIILINQEYETAQNAYDGLIPPVIANVMDLLGHTEDAAEFILQQQREDKIKAEAALAQAQDVNVITDLEVKPAQ